MTTEPAGRVPLTTLAIGFGTAGLATTWTAAHAFLGAPAWTATALWLVAAGVWLSLIAVHAVRGRAAADSLVSQLRHPVQGPVAALVPIVAMLLGARLHEELPALGRIIVVAAIVVSVLFAGWLLGHWVGNGLDLPSLHGGHLLPTVAAGFIASYAAATVGLEALAHAAFAVGAVFWLVLYPLLFARFMFGPPLAPMLVPTIAVMVAPPPVAGVAWWTLHGFREDVVSDGLAGLTLVVVVMQLAVLPRYLRLDFTLGFWSFTFPLAAVGSYAVRWFALWSGPGWRVGAWVAVAVVTGVIGAVAVASLRLAGSRYAVARSSLPLLDHRGASLVE